jgi:formylmethanofuran dehydrogenase subunit A
MTTRRLRGGRVFDPANQVDGEVRDIVMRDGRVVALDPRAPVDEEIDAAGCIVQPAASTCTATSAAAR